MYYENINQKIICYDEDPKRHDKVLLRRIMNNLKDKYRNLIRERNFNINGFREKVIKEIKKLTYLFLPDYSSFYQKIERLFLKEISNNYNCDNNGLIYPPCLHNILEINNYKYSLHFPIGKVTLRNIIENEPVYAPVDKYLKIKDRIRAMSKHERRIDYSKNIMNNFNKNY